MCHNEMQQVAADSVLVFCDSTYIYSSCFFPLLKGNAALQTATARLAANSLLHSSSACVRTGVCRRSAVHMWTIVKVALLIFSFSTRTKIICRIL